MINFTLKTLLTTGLLSLFVLLGIVVKADTPVPTAVSSSYDPATNKLTIHVSWIWSTVANNKLVTAAVFADLNGDGITPTFSSNRLTYNSGGNPFPAGFTALDEFLGQAASSSINGLALPFGDNTDTGIAFQNGFS
jgi:hypothetical protein